MYVTISSGVQYLYTSDCSCAVLTRSQQLPLQHLRQPPASTTPKCHVQHRAAEYGSQRRKQFSVFELLLHVSQVL